MKMRKNFNKLRLTFCLFILCVFFYSNRVNGLFEDQAGTYDWRQQHVGRPLFSHIDLSASKLYLATDQNLLGAVNIKNGNIAWRKIFESSPNGNVDYMISGANELVIVTNKGQKIQGFNHNNGFANWEYVLFSKTDNSNKKLVGIESKQEIESYYLTNGHQLCYVSLKDKACVDLPSDGGYSYAHIFETEKGLFVIGLKEGSIQMIQYNSLLSSILSKTVSAENGNLKWLNSDTNCMKSVDTHIFVCYSSQENKIYSAEIKIGAGIQFIESSLPSGIKNLVWSSRSLFLFESIDRDTPNNEHKQIKLSILKQDEQNGLNLIKSIDSVANYEVRLKEKSSIDYYLIYALYKNSNELSINAYSLGNEQKQEHTVNILTNQKEAKEIIHFRTSLIDGKNGQLGLTSFCFFNDYSMSVFNNQGIRHFTREEALAYITSVEMVDFPLLHLQEEFEDEFGEQQENVFKMFIKRIRSQLFQLKEFVFIDLNQKLTNYLNNNYGKRPVSTKSSASSNTANSILSDEITRDEFNLNKLIVAVTSVGKVFGLYTGANGKMLWNFYLKNVKPYELNNLKHKLSVPLFLQRTAAHVPFEPQCVLVGKYQANKNDDFKTIVYYFNPLTGLPSKDYNKEGIVLNYLIKQAFISNIPNAQFLKPLILLDKENKLHVLPESSADDLIVKANKPSIIYLSEYENEKNSLLIGYAMKYTDKPLPQLWQVSIEDEKIIAIGSKLPNDRIHSHGKVLGDRSVLYKYLNPNLIGVVTTGQDSQKMPFINIYLIDTVTGSIINSFNHKRCKGPVQIVHSENWFFYSYYNLKYRRNEVSTIELFEGSTQHNSTHFSSLDDIKPIVYSKSYIVQKSFDQMQVTLTEKGISTKDIIVACQSGFLIEIPWILIDSRRPIKMTEVEREENLLPYMPEIPLNYEFSLNYYNYVYNVRGIVTAPSGLESTSLVFVYGLDLFFTRVFPSKTFDMIREDFDYFFITTLMVGLILGTFLSKKLASSSNLQKAWK